MEDCSITKYQYDGSKSAYYKRAQKIKVRIDAKKLSATANERL